jgi:hypothetical protein
MKPADTLTRNHTTSKTHPPGQTARISSRRGHGHEANIPTVPGQTHLKTTASTTHTGDLQEHWSRQTRGSVHCQTVKEEKGPGERSGVCECQSAQPLNLGKFLGAEQGKWDANPLHWTGAVHGRYGYALALRKSQGVSSGKGPSSMFPCGLREQPQLKRTGRMQVPGA